MTAAEASLTSLGENWGKYINKQRLQEASLTSLGENPNPNPNQVAAADASMSEAERVREEVQ